MTEDAPKEEKKAAPPNWNRKMSKVINDVLGVNLDWTQLCERDLKILHAIVTDDRRLRRLAIRVLRHRVKGLGHEVKKEARGMVRDLITESGIGDRALKLLVGDDEKCDDDGLDDGE